MRWSKFKNNDSRDIYDVISQRVFPAIKNMKHGRLPDFNEKGEPVDIADDSDSDEQNGQFRTPQAHPGNDGGAAAAHPGRYHLRSGLWYSGLSGLRFGVYSQPLRGHHDF